VPIRTFSFLRSPARRLVAQALSTLIDWGRLQAVERRAFSADDRENGHGWPGYADTMIGLKRLDSLQQCIEAVLQAGVPGDLIETGVWRGGACIFMRGVLAAYGVTDRRVWVADSFQGLPEPDVATYPVDTGDLFYTQTLYAVAQADVAANFCKYGLLDDQVVFLPGWFKDTLPHAPIDRLAVMRLDGDMYGSTMDALVHLYPKLSSGGFCIIDDYALPRCQAAVEDYRTAQGITSPICAIDWTGRYWRKD